MKHLMLPLAVVAGFAGGALSHYLLPGPTAQPQALASDMVSARSFAIVDASGKPVGVFAAGAPSKSFGSKSPTSPPIALFNADGKEIWRAGDARQPLLTVQ
jgi:hypothetical protein